MGKDLARDGNAMGCMMRDTTVCFDEFGNVTLRELEFAELAHQLADRASQPEQPRDPAGECLADPFMDVALDLLRWSSRSNVSRAYVRNPARWRAKRGDSESVH